MDGEFLGQLIGRWHTSVRVSDEYSNAQPAVDFEQQKAFDLRSLRGFAFYLLIFSISAGFFTAFSAFFAECKEIRPQTKFLHACGLLMRTKRILELWRLLIFASQAVEKLKCPIG